MRSRRRGKSTASACFIPARSAHPPKSDDFMQLFRTVQKDIHRLQGCHWGRLQEMANKIDFFLTPMLGKLADEREKPIILP